MAGGDGKDKKAAEPQEYKFATKPEEKTGWEGFKQFLWNSETGEFLGRTGMSWLKIGVFYVIYYALLAGFFMGMLLIFYQTLDNKIPRWQNTNGIIGGNPGVGFRPMPDNKSIESTLIWFRHGDDNGNWEHWVKRLDDFLKPYHEEIEPKDESGAKKEVTRVDCGEHGEDSAGDNQVCKINRDELFQNDCTKEKHYGYKDGNPCILLKLNKIYGWYPEYYNNSGKIPDSVPQEIKDIIAKNAEAGEEALNRRVWIQCVGENPADVENAGEIVYYPYQGFSANFFPYFNQPGYVSPAVFMQLKGPRKGVMIAIECRAYAANIEHDSMERRGLAHFEVMID